MKHTLATSLAGAALVFAACSSESGETNGPVTTSQHVLLITCDTLRADRLGMYGYQGNTSPNLDALATEGVVFEEAYSTAPMTLPAISSMLTGRLPADVGVDYDNHRHMSAGVHTLPELLRDRADVATGAIVSNWVLRRPPGVDPQMSTWQGFDTYDDRMGDSVVNRDGHWERTAPSTTEAAIEWLTAHQNDPRTFLWVHYQDPHGPYTPPQEFAAAFAPTSFAGTTLPLGGNRWGLGQVPNYQQAHGDEARPEAYRANYDAEIAYFDRELGRLIAWMRQSGRLDQSMVIFTADHGESLGDHNFWFSHGEHVYRDVVRVPLFVRMPGGKVAPHTHKDPYYRRSSLPVGLIDIFPTVAEAFGVEPGSTRGTSLISIRDQSVPYIYGQFLHAESDRSTWQAFSDGQYRVVQETLPGNQPGMVQLYDVRADPFEQNNLVTTPEAQEIMNSLSQRIGAYLNRTQQTPLPGINLTQLVTPEDRAQHVEAMNKLGYTGGDEDDATPPADGQ